MAVERINRKRSAHIRHRGDRGNLMQQDNTRGKEPHPVLPAYYHHYDQRLSFVRTLFDESAPHYDRINRVFSLGSGARYRRQCLVRAGMRPGLRVADIAIGTGSVAQEVLAITKNQNNIVGVDISAAMLEVARSKIGVPLVQGNADQLPFADMSFDFVTMGYALRHVSDLIIALTEFHRVLRPGGTVLLLEIGKPSNTLSRALLAAYLGGLVPLASKWITGSTVAQTLMRYYWDTIANCVSPEVVLDAMRSSGFTEIDCKTDFNFFRSYTARRSP
jgi:demethylmenaquinone methyltransferase / 2-methoxy-6-polyprenyl-1,4-benzoquinol methylase